MKVFDVTFSYLKDDNTNTETIRVNSNGTGKAVAVAMRSFNNKHKKDLNKLSDITYDIKQIIKENDEI